MKTPIRSATALAAAGWLTLLALLSWTPAHAQHDAEYSMYMFNGLYLNPAYAGSQGGPNMTAIYRHQWTQLEGAPRTFNVSGDSPFRREQYALGGSMHYDQIGPEKKYKADIDFAFRIQVGNPDNIMAFGIRTGFMYYQVQPGEYRPSGSQPTDPVLDATYRTFVPNLGFGVYAYGKRYFAGVSLPHMLNLNLKPMGDGAGYMDYERQFQHIFFTAGGVIGKEYGKVKVKPSLLYKYAIDQPWDFDFNLSFLFIERLWIGASYRTGGEDEDRRGESVVGILKFKATQQLEIGYAYDHTLSRLGDFNNGSHEIMIAFDLSIRNKQFVTPRYIRYF